MTARLRRLECRQLLPVTPAAAWEFFSRPENLARITPPDLGFEVTSPLPERMHAGMIVTYRVSPFGRLRVPWVTEITHVREPEFFVDEQRSGPYRFWHHQHHFRAVADGVEMTDLLHYRLPFGCLRRPAGRGPGRAARGGDLCLSAQDSDGAVRTGEEGRR